MSQCNFLQQFAKLNRELKQWQHAWNERVRKYIFSGISASYTLIPVSYTFLRVGHVFGICT